MSQFFMKSSFTNLIRFRVDNARVFQQVSMILCMTVGEVTCQLLCRCTQSVLSASCV